MLFHRKKETPSVTFDPASQKPVLHCSICTGEQVVGFKDLATGHFTEVMLVRDEADLEQFRKTYGLKEIDKEY